MQQRRQLIHFSGVKFLCFLCGLPGLVAAVALLWLGAYPAKVWLTVGILVIGCWLFLTLRLLDKMTRPLQTASNMLAALREGDYSMQAANMAPDDPIGELFQEINSLGDVLRQHKTGALEANSLLEKVLAGIDAAVMTFDPQRRLTVVNDTASRLLNAPVAQLRGRTAEELLLEGALSAEPDSVVPLNAGGNVGRYSVRHGTFHVGGQPNELLILIDVTRSLREEELQAWKKLIRVISHELNNSMAPISSLSSSLLRLITRDPLPTDWQEDMAEGLDVIHNRAESLNRFLLSYALLARLPAPRKVDVDLAKLLRRLCSLPGPTGICCLDGPDNLIVKADPDQLEQALINIIKNAQEAAAECSGTVSLKWHHSDTQVLVLISDTGPGLANEENLFIPFFSTKQHGSGIGLTLARQIIEGHGGQLLLKNRTDCEHGCEVTVSFPYALL